MIHPLHPDYRKTPVARKTLEFRERDPESERGVTVMTPLFNPTELFFETLVSVRAQTFQQWEWVVVDDGTSDPKSLEILNDAALAEPRIRIVRHPVNLGLSAARNTGYREARAEYVFQIDGDDLLEPTALEKYLWFLETNPSAGFVSSLQVGFGLRSYLYPGGFFDRSLFLSENRTDTAAMVRRETFRAVGGYREENRDGLEDWEFWLGAAERGIWGYSVPEYLEWYRWSGEGRWPNWHDPEKRQKFISTLPERFPKIFSGNFPSSDFSFRTGLSQVRSFPQFLNELTNTGQRAVLFTQSLEEGRTSENLLAATKELQGKGYQVSIVIFEGGSELAIESELSELTPDLFTLSRFLPSHHFFQFLCYFINSRETQLLISFQNELSHLGSLIRGFFPELSIVEAGPLGEAEWRRDLRGIL